ncbi:hypothetical protein KY284_010966 [Solanum tuberosum]|nr:hypothetical protein KY284_010966 [Solanum tuberosum]
MKDQIFQTIDGSIKVVKDSWSKDIAEIRCMLQEVLEKLSPTTPQFSLDSYSSFVKIPRFNGDDPATWVFQENCDSKEISKSNLDDNKEDPLPFVLIMTYTNVRGGVPLHITKTGVEVTVNKAQKLFGIYSHKTREQLVDNKVVDLLWERSDLLILDGTRLMHTHIFINFPFDLGESIPPSIMFKSVDIQLDISHYLSIELYSSVIVLDGTTKGGKLLGEMLVAKWADKPVNLDCHDHFQNHLSKLYYWSFLAQLEQSVEMANEFDFEGLVMIGVVDSKINACLVAANFNSEMQPATLAAMSPEWKVLKLRSNYKLKLQAVHPIGYTFYGAIEMAELVVRHILRLDIVAMHRFGGERASNVVHQYFKEDNFSLDGSDHVKQYLLYHISSASVSSSDPSSTLDVILVINVQKLCKNNRVNSGIIKAANQITILFIMAFTCSSQGIYNTPSFQMKFLDMNLEVKVLSGGRSIVVIHNDFIRAYGLDATNMTDLVDIIGPSKMLESFIWDPGPIIYC